MKTTYHRLIKWVLCWEICPKFGYLCGRTEMLLVRSISREMQIWHSSTQGQILRWKKKKKNPLTEEELKRFTAAGDVHLHCMSWCVYGSDALLVLGKPRSHTCWQLFNDHTSFLWSSMSHLSGSQTHQRKTQNHRAWLVNVSWLWYCS